MSHHKPTENAESYKKRWNTKEKFSGFGGFLRRSFIFMKLCSFIE